MSTEETGGEDSDRSRRAPFLTLLREALVTLRQRPRLVVPFVIAGLVAALLDALQLEWGVATVVQTTDQYGIVHIPLQLLPDVISPVITAIPAVLGLRTIPLTRVLLGETVTALLGTTATVIVLSRLLAPSGKADQLSGKSGRATDFGQLLRCVPRLCVYELLVGSVLFAGVTVGSDLGLFTLVLVVVLLHIAGRLFLVPAAVVAGRSLTSAVRWSWRRTYGRTWTTAGALVAIGGTAHLVRSVPVLLPVVGGIAVPLPLGTLLATGSVGALHATLVATTARAYGDADSETPDDNRSQSEIDTSYTSSTDSR
jgi:hypothetical protein